MTLLPEKSFPVSPHIFFLLNNHIIIDLSSRLLKVTLIFYPVIIGEMIQIGGKGERWHIQNILNQ